MTPADDRPRTVLAAREVAKLSEERLWAMPIEHIEDAIRLLADVDVQVQLELSNINNTIRCNRFSKLMYQTLCERQGIYRQCRADVEQEKRRLKLVRNRRYDEAHRAFRERAAGLGMTPVELNASEESAR